MTAVVTMKQLLEAGVHFGHQTRRWNPKMKRFIHGDRNGIYIIDLQQTLQRIEVAYSFVRDTVADGGTVLFVGTKKQAQGPVQSYAEKCNMPYINERWLGGMLTNFETMAKRVSKMKEYQRMRDSGEFEAMPKKEALLISRELEKLERNLGGIRNMEKLPDIVFVLDTKKEHIAVTESNKLGIPLVAVVDTNCDPDVIQYVIPGNDDAIRSGDLMCRVIADAVIEGRFIRSRREGADGGGPRRSLRQEDEVAAQQAEARRQAALAAAEREARIAAGRGAGDQAAAEEPVAAEEPAAAVEPAAAEPTAATPDATPETPQES
jgi:small subunit ribosomal protein S2